MEERLTKKNLSVDKVFKIIEVMANSKGPMRLQDISNHSEHPASTVLRMINALISINYVQQDPETMRYYLTTKFCRIGDAVRAQFSIQEMIRPFLLDLAERCQESSCLAIEQDMSVVYIDTVEGPDNMLRTLQRIGKVAPMHSTGVGKLLLTNYDRAKIDAYVQQKGLEPTTINTITDVDQLVTELDKIREQGYALDDEECEIGARCVAAPIKDYTGKIVSCISVSGPTTRITGDKMNRIISIILEESEKASNRLGYYK